MTAVQNLWFTDYEVFSDDYPLVTSGQSFLSWGNQSHFDSMLDLDTDEEENSVNKNSYIEYISRNPAKKNESQNPLDL